MNTNAALPARLWHGRAAQQHVLRDGAMGLKEIGGQLTIGEDADGKTSVMVDFNATLEADGALVAAIGAMIEMARHRGIDVARTLDPLCCALCGKTTTLTPLTHHTEQRFRKAFASRSIPPPTSERTLGPLIE